MPELLGLPYSPWSEKARWALDVRRVPYRFRHYQPLLGEPALRWKLRRFKGRVTVPVLTTDDGQVLADSADIARWADGRGDGPVLFPAEHEDAMTRFIALSDHGLAAGRALSLERMLVDDEALAELVPRGMRHVPLAVRMAEMGVRRTVRKYEADKASTGEHRRALRGALAEVRAALSRAVSPGPRTLLGRFSFADIAVTQMLIAVEPPSSGLKLGAGSRRCFLDPELREAYGDLVAWRDELYAEYRSLS